MYYRFVRLTHEQWENSVRDVLKLPDRTGLSSGFVPDPPEGKFENNERALYVSANLRTDYQRTAEELAERVASDSGCARAARQRRRRRRGSFAASAGSAFRRALTAAEETTFERALLVRKRPSTRAGTTSPTGRGS